MRFTECDGPKCGRRTRREAVSLRGYRRPGDDARVLAMRSEEATFCSPECFERWVLEGVCRKRRNCLGLWAQAKVLRDEGEDAFLPEDIPLPTPPAPPQPSPGPQETPRNAPETPEVAPGINPPAPARETPPGPPYVAETTLPPREEAHGATLPPHVLEFLISEYGWGKMIPKTPPGYVAPPKPSRPDPVPPRPAPTGSETWDEKLARLKGLGRT